METVNLNPITPVARADSEEDTRKYSSCSPTTLGDDGPASKEEVKDEQFHASGVVNEKSRGVFEMENLSSRLNLKYKIFLYGGFLLLAYSLSLGERYWERSSIVSL